LGFSDKVQKASSLFALKGGQGAKLGNRRASPGNNSNQRNSEVRGLKEGETAISLSCISRLIHCSAISKPLLN